MTDPPARPTDGRVPPSAAAGFPGPASTAILGSLATAASVWGIDDGLERSALLILAAGFVLTLLLRRPGWWPAGASAVVVAVATLTIPTIGKGAVLLGLASVVALDALLRDWRPLPPWPPRSRRVVLLGLPWWVAAQVLVATRGSRPVVVALLALTFVVVELHHRAPAAVARVDEPVRRVLGAAAAVTRLDVGAAFVATAAGEAAAWVRASVRSGGRWILGRKDRRDRSFLTAVLVGAGLRAAWIVMAAPSEVSFATPYSGWNVRIATQLAERSLPTFGSVPTAYWPPGYGMALAPLAWLADRTGASLTTFAVWFNAAAGTVTIVLVAFLAQRCFGPATRNVAAWFMALAFGHVHATAAVVAETFATTIFVAVALGIQVALDRPDRSARLRALFGVGVLAGYAVLVRDVALTLLVLPLVAVRVRSGRWRGEAVRSTIALAAGSLLLMVPWAVRNWVQVGWPSPLATISSEGLCATKYDLDIRRYFTENPGPEYLGRELLQDCYRNSPFDTDKEYVQFSIPPEMMAVEGPDEGAWARRNNLGYWRWAVTHPHVLLKNIPLRVHGALGNDREGGWRMASEFGARQLAGPLATEVHGDLANGWYFLTAGLTVLALVRLPAVRRAAIVWFPPLIYSTYTWLGPWSLSRHIYPAYAFFAVMAAAAVAAIGRAGLPVPPEPAPARSEDDDG